MKLKHWLKKKKSFLLDKELITDAPIYLYELSFVYSGVFYDFKVRANWDLQVFNKAIDIFEWLGIYKEVENIKVELLGTISKDIFGYEWIQYH